MILKNVLKDITGLVDIRDKKFWLTNLPYLFLFYLANIFSKHINSYVGGDQLNKIMYALNDLKTMSYIPPLSEKDLFIGLAVAGLIRFIVYEKKKNAKKFRQGIEYGSARWGTKKDIEPYIDKNFENNLILTNTEYLTMNSRPANLKYARNKNVLVVGGSGSGKTRFFLKPNLMQMHSSYCITDLKGTVLLECGKMLEKNGYDIYLFFNLLIIIFLFLFIYCLLTLKKITISLSVYP